MEDVGLKIEDLPLVYGVSGHTEDEYKKQAKKNGIKDILEKPLYLSNLRNVLREVSILWLNYIYNIYILIFKSSSII